MAELKYKLGKTLARKGAIKFELAKYETSVLPQPPLTFGHQALVKTWNMLGNDQYGDCVWAGAGHEHILWNKEAGKVTNFTDANVLSDYSAVTGFNPNDPDTDQGTDMVEAASYRRKTGIIDSIGTRHTIGAYLNVRAGDIAQIKQAVFLYSAVGIGIQFPNSAMDQFNAGKPWTVKRGARIEGGHYVPVVGYDSRHIYVVTWGRLQACSYAFIRRYMDEGIVYLSQDFLTNSGKTLEGFDLDTLIKNLNSL